MSRKNVELVRKASELWNSGGIEALLTLYPEDVVWYPFPEWPESPSEYRGHQGIREVMRAWDENFEAFRVTPKDVHDLGDRALFLGFNTGTIKGSNAAIRQEVAILAWDFCEGKIGKARFFLSWEEGGAAAGISR